MTRLRETRKAKRLTQDNVAAQTGISRTYYNHLEAGRRLPSLKVALHLARIFAVPVEDLFPLNDAS